MTIKLLLATFGLLFLPTVSQAQDNRLELDAYFTAIIVRDMDASIQWYENALGLELINKVESSERGFKQANLKGASMALELIELDSALRPEDVISSYDSKTRMLGFFKTGFAVSEFDEWHSHLESQSVKFYGNVATASDGKRMMIKRIRMVIAFRYLRSNVCRMVRSEST